MVFGRAFAAEVATSGSNAADEMPKGRPQPTKYQEIMKESFGSIHLDTFEGFRLDLTKPLNNNFAMMHSVYMGNESIPPSITGAPQTLKISTGTYDIGAICFKENAYFFRGRYSSQGMLQGTAKFDLPLKDTSAIAQFQMTSEEVAGFMVDVDTKGADWNGQLKFGSGPYYGANYMQSVTDAFSAGAEFFLLKQPQSNAYVSGLGFAGRYQGKDWATALQATSTRLVSAMYAHRFYNDKLTLATEAIYNFNTGAHTCTVGYDYMFRNARVRGTINSNWVVSAQVEEKLSPGFTLVMTGEVDNKKDEYKFGFGLTLEPMS